MPFHPFYLLQYYAKVKSIDNLNNWQVPTTTYQAFLSGVTNMYDTAPAYSRYYSDIMSQYIVEGVTGGTAAGGGSAITGGTANGANSTLIFNNASGGSFTVANSALLFNDAYVSGGTLNSVTGVVTFINTTGGTFQVSGFNGFTSYWSANTDGSISPTGVTDVRISGDTFNKGKLVVSGRTFLGTVDAVTPTTTSTDKILVVQSTGEIESITKAQLTGLTQVGLTSYWSANTDGSISPTGVTDVRISGNTFNKGTLTTGEVLNVIGEDPRVKLYADAGDHPGLELYDGTTRKWILYNDPNDSHNLNIKAEDVNTDRVSITQTGKVGIGTTDPQKMLDIAGGDIRLDNSKGIYFATTDANISRVSIIGDEGSDFIRMKVDNSNSHVLQLNTTGVGIGTTDPNENLTVVGSISATTNLYFNMIDGGSF